MSLLQMLALGATLGFLMAVMSHVWNVSKFQRAAMQSAPVVMEAVSSSYHSFGVYRAEIQPSELRVIPVETSKASGQLVIRQTENSVRRILLLWKTHDPAWNRCIKLEDCKGRIDDVISASVEEAQARSQELFQKRNKKHKGKPAQEQLQVQEQIQVPVAPAPVHQPVAEVVVQEPVIAHGSPAVEKPEAKPLPPVPAIKGYKYMTEGIFVDGSVQQHVKTGKGSAGETYSTYTVTLHTDHGPEQCTGNDLKRALGRAQVEPGHRIKVIQLGDKALEGGRTMKCYEIINKTRAAELAVAS